MFKITPYRSSYPRKESYNNVFDLFDDFFNETRNPQSNFKIDVSEKEKDYIIEVETPGVSKDNIEIHYENDYLTIDLKKEEIKEEENKNYLHKERYTESSTRSIYLKDIDASKLTAKQNNGILSIIAPKLESKTTKYLIDIE